MIYFKKSNKAPKCLAVEKLKENGNYRCGSVLRRLKKDFKNKCYICEQSAPVSINVEHFVSHKKSKDLKFDWNNLFWSCSHCNNTKLASYDNILNCTNPEHKVDEWIKYKVESYPKEKVILSPNSTSPLINTTIELLDKVYNGHTKLKIIEAANLRQKLVKSIAKFQDLMSLSFEEEADEAFQAEIKKLVKKRLRPKTSFTAFKKWIIRENPALMDKFGDLL